MLENAGSNILEWVEREQGRMGGFEEADDDVEEATVARNLEEEI